MAWRRRSGWIYTGFALFGLALFLMVMRYLGVVFETNAKAQIALKGMSEGGYALLHVAAILDWVRWRWIADVLMVGSGAVAYGLGRDWWQNLRRQHRQASEERGDES